MKYPSTSIHNNGKNINALFFVKHAFETKDIIIREQMILKIMIYVEASKIQIPVICSLRFVIRFGRAETFLVTYLVE